jgi:outer membrane protein
MVHIQRLGVYIGTASIILLWSAAGSAQDSLRILDLKQVLTKALNFNNDIKKAATSVATSDIGVRQAKADFLPSVNAGAGLTHGVTGRSNPTTSRSTSLDVSTEMTLFNGFSGVASLRNAKSTYLANLSTLEAQKQLVLYTAFEYYVQASLDSELVRIQTENLNAENKLLEKIDAFQKSGQRSLGDVLTQKTAAAKAELTLVNARYAYDVSKLKLLRLMGEDSLRTDFRLASVLPDSTDISISLSSDTTLSVTLARRKDVEAQRHTIEASYAQIASAKSGYWPSLSLNAGVSTGYSGGGPGDVGSQLFDDNLSTSVGLSLSVPIFDKFTAKNNVAIAKTKAQQEENNLKELQRQTLFEVRQALLDYHAAEEQARVTQVEFESATQALDAVQTRYDVGAATLTDLIQSRSQYLTAVNDRAEAKVTLALRTIGVGYYCGTVPKILALYTGTEKN